MNISLLRSILLCFASMATAVGLLPVGGKALRSRDDEEAMNADGSGKSSAKISTQIRKLQQQPSCSVCGDGMQVGNPNAAVTFPGQAGQISCDSLENMGTVGLIPPAQCAVLPQLIDTVCECEFINPPTTAGTKPGKAGKTASPTALKSSKSDKPDRALQGHNESSSIELL